MSRHIKRIDDQTGFTIVETMIATVIFAIVLVVFTTAIVVITQAYYKGITQAKTQDTARTVINDVASAIQLGGGSFTQPSNSSGSPVTFSYCFTGSNTAFLFDLGTEVEASANSGLGQGYHALVVQSNSNCSGGTVPTIANQVIAGGGQDILGPNMSLSNFQIVCLNPAAIGGCTPGSQNVYQVTVDVLYGDKTLFTNWNTPNAKCVAQTDTQLCAAETLSTIVAGRIK